MLAEHRGAVGKPSRYERYGPAASASVKAPTIYFQLGAISHEKKQRPLIFMGRFSSRTGWCAIFRHRFEFFRAFRGLSYSSATTTPTCWYFLPCVTALG